MFILVRGELHVLDNNDRSSSMFKVAEGTVFGEATVLRQMEVSMDLIIVWNLPCTFSCV